MGDADDLKRVDANRLFQKAKYHFRKGEYPEVKDYLAAAWKSIEGCGNPAHLADISHRIADYSYRIGDCDTTETFSRIAIENEVLAGRSALLANHLMFYALFLEKQRQYQKALEYAEKGYAEYRNYYGEDHGETRKMLTALSRIKTAS